MSQLIRSLAMRVATLFRRRKLDDDLDQELRSHLENAIDLNIQQGMNEEEARRQAHITLGGVVQIKELYREQQGLPMVETAIQDLCYGLRMIRKNPGFTAVAVLSIALGIGANTAIFSLIYALMLRWLPVPNPSELMRVTTVIQGKPSDSFSYLVIKALADRKDLFANLGGFSGNSFTVGPPSAPVFTPGAFVSGGFFPALELQPIAGRLLGPEDDMPGAPLAAVISDGYWERRFQRDPRAIGGTLQVEGRAVAIVGVTPPGFTGATVGEIADLTMTFQALPQLDPNRAGLLGAGNQFNRILARLAPGLSVEEARSRLKVIWPTMASVSVSPNAPAKRREAMLASTLDLVPGGTGWTYLRGQYSKPLYILMCISSLVLLVACANVANLLLARSTARRREIAIRLAIGAGRGRVIRQLLMESLLLASLGAAVGLCFAGLGSRFLLQSVSGGSRPIPLDVGLNGEVLGFTIAIAVFVALLFGLAPAFRATSAGPAPVLKSREHTSSLSGGRLAPSLVSGQVALSLLLMIGAGLFIQTLRNLQAIDPGFRHHGVLMLSVDGRRLVKSGAQSDARLPAFYREGLEAIAHLNGVQAVSLSNFTPVSGGFWSQSVLVNGQHISDEEPPFFAVSPGYFAALGIPLVAGRDFTNRDVLGAMPVVIVNEEFVRRFMPGGHPLGQRVSAADSRFWKNMEIVGITANSVPYSLREPPRPCVFVPFFQQSPERMGFGTYEIKAAGSLGAVSPAAEEIMRSRAPGLPLKVVSFTAQVEDSIRREILMAQLAGFFGVLSLVLAAVGFYGLLAYMVTQRTSEIGIRMALGAQRRQVVSMVLAGALRLLTVGVLLGLCAAWWTSRLLTTMLYGLEPTDPITIATSVVVLTAAALVAGFLPAHRAARVEPMVALKYE
jgi:putative ABC transport system permease protein